MTRTFEIVNFGTRVECEESRMVSWILYKDKRVDDKSLIRRPTVTALLGPAVGVVSWCPLRRRTADAATPHHRHVQE